MIRIVAIHVSIYFAPYRDSSACKRVSKVFCFFSSAACTSFQKGVGVQESKLDIKKVVSFVKNAEKSTRAQLFKTNDVIS